MSENSNWSSFNAGWSFVAAIVSAITFAIAAFNLAVDVFSLPLAPFAEPLIALFGHLADALYWIDVRVDWAIPDWPPSATIATLLLGTLSIRAFFAAGSIVEPERSVSATRWQNQFGRAARIQAVVLIIFAIPILRWLVVAMAVLMPLGSLMMWVSNFIPGTTALSVYKAYIAYFVGHILAAAALLAANYYYS